MARRKKRRLKKALNTLIYIAFIILLYLFATNLLYNSKVIANSTETLNKNKSLATKYTYFNCMNSSYKSENLQNDFENLFNSYKGKNIAIYFTDINNDYSYYLNENKTYYSASVVKLFDAIYLIEKAKNGQINLDDTITYTANDKKGGSSKTDMHNFNDKISLKDLINYAISVSDNAAHFMLVKYIGANNLNKYFKNNYNINLNITNEKPFEYNYTAKMANEALKLVYKILDANDEYSKLLREAMNNDYVNGLNFDNNKFLHKYGFFSSYYHDIGIYDEENPYLISILTLSGESGYSDIVPKIHKEINEIYKENIRNKEKYCSNL